MDGFFSKQLRDNTRAYKRSLDRIIDKYSKLQYHDGGIEVNLDCTKPKTLQRYIKMSKTELSKLDLKSQSDLREEALTAQDITRNSQLDFTHHDINADETCASNDSATQLSLDEGTSGSDTTSLTVSPLDESQQTLSEAELQPEDEDEELEMSLRSHGCPLVDLYPSMIGRIKLAWRRQHVSEAANSVLRRYRRWRQQQPNRSYLNNTFVVPQRPTNGNLKKMSSSMLLGENSVVDRQRTGAEMNPWPPSHIGTNLQDWQAQQQQQSNWRVRGSQRREQNKPVLVMDFSDPPETFTPKEISLYETFTVSPEEPEQEEQPSTYTISPSPLSLYPTAKASLDPSLRSKRLAGGGCSMNALQTTAVNERPDIYGSPVRQSPLQSRATSGLSRSPQAFSRSPRAYSVESFSREPVRCRSMSTSLSSPQQKPTVPLRQVCPPVNHPPQPQLSSPQLAAAGRHKLRRHLSFDSSPPSTSVSYSPKKLDEDFIKVYHKFVCQNKSPLFNGAPCRFCARSSAASRSHSSSALAALALSPHRSVLGKRHRELGWDSHPQSKRSRDECCVSSPGSKRHGMDMLRRQLAPSLEQAHDGLSYSPSKHDRVQRWGSQQYSAGAPQDTWMSQSRRVSGAEVSQGSSLEGKMANGYSPRKWW